MKTKELLKGIIISIAAIGVGYFAISVPFNIFDSFSKSGQRLFFITEIVIYLIVSFTYLIIKDKKQQQMKKEKARHQKRLEKIQDVQENWINIAA